jgi:RimJ/RimL family protein N-acetyltransferase
MAAPAHALTRSQIAAAPRALHTPRLRLLAPQLEFAAPFVESLNLSLPALAYIGWGQQARTLDWAQTFMAEGMRWVDEGDCLIYYAWDSTSACYVGRVDLHSWDFDAPRCEVGYVGDVRTAGQGLMREAVLACVQSVFELGVARVQALSEASNTRALHFAERALGFTREGVLRNFERDAQGRLGDQVVFATYNPMAV